jgi:hypothetical protein
VPLESYVQRTDAAREFWATPSCNVGGTWELAVGAAATDMRAHGHYGLQAKTVLKPLDAGGWGIGWCWPTSSATDAARRRPVGQRAAQFFAARRQRAAAPERRRGAHPVTRSTDATWGVGAEFKLNERNSLTAEAYGQQRNGSRYQFGYAHALIPDRLQIDATWGQRGARRQRDHGHAGPGPANQLGSQPPGWQRHRRSHQLLPAQAQRHTGHRHCQRAEQEQRQARVHLVQHRQRNVNHHHRHAGRRCQQHSAGAGMDA